MIIITDSASDITLIEAKSMNVEIIPLTTTFKDTVLPQETHEDFDLFFKTLMNSDELPITSQPSPSLYIECYEKYPEEDILVITLSSGLSGTFNAANLAKETVGRNTIRIVDSKSAILGQRLLVEYAVKRRAEGANIETITSELETLKDRVVVLGALDTLKYLKMGGRIPSTLAVVGEFLKIKPTIILSDGVLSELGIARGNKKAIESLHKKIDMSGVDTKYPIYFGYTLDKSRGDKFMSETIQKYRMKNTIMAPVGGIIGTHVGPNCIAIAFVIEEK